MPLAEAILKILAELIVVSALNLLPFRRLRSIDATLKALRRDLRRIRDQHGRRLDQHERRIDRHDENAGINTKET